MNVNVNDEGLIACVDYVAYRNPIGTKKVLNKYGYTGTLEPENVEQSVEAALDLIQREGQDALNDLMKEHPDRQFILPSLKGNKSGRRISDFFGFDNSDSPDESGEYNYKYGNRSNEERISSIEKEISETKNMLKYFAIGAVILVLLNNK